MTPAEAKMPLTAREREIAGFVADGLRSQDIADRLFVSVRTVHSHLRSIYIKTETGSRVRLAIWLDENNCRATEAR